MPRWRRARSVETGARLRYHPYKRVREGRAKGEAYFMGVTRYASSYSLLVNFSSSLGWLILINFCLLFLDLWIITTTNVHKKK